MAHRDFFKHVSRVQHRTKRYRNPYFSPTKRPWPWKKLLIWGVSALCILTLIVVLFSNLFFGVESVSVVGLTHTPREDLETQVNEYLQSSVYLFFTRSNQFLFRNDILEQQLETHMNLARASIHQDGARVETTLEERTPNLLWPTKNRTYVVALDGIVVREATQADRSQALPLFVDQNDAAIEPGNVILTKEEIIRIFDFQKRIGELGIFFTQTNVNRVAGKSMNLVMQDGYEIYFDDTGDIPMQVSNLKTLLEQHVIDPSAIEYVDLRFGDQVFYK